MRHWRLRSLSPCFVSWGTNSNQLNFCLFAATCLRCPSPHYVPLSVPTFVILCKAKHQCFLMLYDVNMTTKSKTDIEYPRVSLGEIPYRIWRTSGDTFQFSWSAFFLRNLFDQLFCSWEKNINLQNSELACVQGKLCLLLRGHVFKPKRDWVLTISVLICFLFRTRLTLAVSLYLARWIFAPQDFLCAKNIEYFRNVTARKFTIVLAHLLCFVI